MKRALCSVVVCGAVMVATAGQVHAGLIVTAFESGGNVVFSGGGTVNLGGLMANDINVGGNGFVQPAFGNFFIGNNPDNDAINYKGASGPGDFGPGVLPDQLHVFADSNTGDLFGINGRSTNLYVPFGFTGGQLSGTSTYLATTLSALGLTEGEYVWSWSADKITLIVDADAFPEVVPEPTTLAIWSLLGVVGLVVGGRQRRKQKANKQVE